MVGDPMEHYDHSRDLLESQPNDRQADSVGRRAKAIDRLCVIRRQCWPKTVTANYSISENGNTSTVGGCQNKTGKFCIDGTSKVKGDVPCLAPTTTSSTALGVPLERNIRVYTLSPRQRYCTISSGRGNRTRQYWQMPRRQMQSRNHIIIPIGSK